jgi:ferredoxin
MHMKHSDIEHGPREVPVKFILEDPHGLTGTSQREHTLLGAVGESLLELAMEHGINIEHACGGVCACSTCHVYIERGNEFLSEAQESEEDRVDEAPGLQRNSRLSCQCHIERSGLIELRVPSWNRNAIKEIPH